MNTHQVLLLSDDTATLLPALEQSFESSPELQVKFIAPVKVYPSDFIESEFIILDYAYSLKNPEAAKLAFAYPEKLSICATLTEEQRDRQQMNEILKTTKVSHFFGMSGSHTLGDIKHYLVASITRQFWTVETLITPPVSNRSRTVFSTTEHLDQQIVSAIGSHDLSHTFDGFKAILVQILNEILTNALFNAPVDEHGNFLHRDQNRRNKIISAAGKEPSLEIVEDEDKIILSVKDFYGTLTKDVIDHYLTHGEVADKDGGAGVGLFLVLKHAHKVVINIDPGKMTEFIIVIHKFKRFFHYQALEKSFHLFQRNRT